ncbi:MAG: glycosyltransferase family 2 protein [Microgenomates group bacterium]
MSLSVVINTRNAAETLEEALKSVTFADEIIIMDMESTDHTLSIAQKYTSNIFSHHPVGFVEPARNEAISKATKKWILVLDADEIVPKTLATLLTEISQDESEEFQSIDCLKIPRKNIIFGDWVQSAGWWPDFLVRFFKKNSVIWPEDIHAVPEMTGIVAQLPAEEKYALIHNNYTSVKQFLERLNTYTSVQASQKMETTLPPTPIDVLSDELLRRLFVWNGITGSYRGACLSILQSLAEVATYTKILESREFNGILGEIESVASLERFRKSLAYWVADWNVKNSVGIYKVFWMIRRRFAV